MHLNFYIFFIQMTFFSVCGFKMHQSSRKQCTEKRIHGTICPCLVFSLLCHSSEQEKMQSSTFQEKFLAAHAAQQLTTQILTQSTNIVNLEFAFMADTTQEWKKTSPAPPKAHQLSKVPRGFVLEIVTHDLLSYRVLCDLHVLDLRSFAA